MNDDQRSKLATVLLDEALTCSERGDKDDARTLMRQSVAVRFRDEIEKIIKDITPKGFIGISEFNGKNLIDDLKENIKGKVAIIFRKHEPFTEQETIGKRVEYIAKKGAAAIIIGDPKIGRRMEYSSVWDTRDPDSINPPLPIINTSHEHLLLLKKYAILGRKAKIEVQTDFYEATTSNVITEIPGSVEDEFIVMCGHHDTVFDTPGGNDNTSGAISVIETAKSIKRTFDKFNITPKIGLRFVTLSAEEQRLQGSFHHVNNNYKKLKTHDKPDVLDRQKYINNDR